MAHRIPRLLLAGTHSGCGKTTVTSAVLQAFVNRGTIPAAFKCGPDYIDPMFHTEIIGAPSRNLDLFLCSPDTVRGLLVKNAAAAPLAVIEGVMGFYDGVGGTTAEASACDLANRTETPAVLVVDARGMSLSAAALVRGYRDLAPNTLRGVILNGVSTAMVPTCRRIIEEHTGLRVYGHLPRIPEAALGSRHLGLITADEVADLKARLARLADAAERYIDLDGLRALAESAPPLCGTLPTAEPAVEVPVRIGLARDKAFCFYYEDSLDLLRALGAELVPFSPLADRTLPEGLDGLYLGGGYPELYADTLAENRTMRESVRAAVAGGLPTLAECGGFLYLHDTLDGKPMAGVLRGGAVMRERLQPFGYVTLTAERDTLLCAHGESLRAHEFHYAASDHPGNACTARKPVSSRAWPCVHGADTLFAGFPHIHFYANPACAARFVRCCARYREEKRA